MSIAVEPQQMAVAVPTAAPVRPARPWVFSPSLDLLFLANLTWPLVVLAALGGAALSSWEGSPVVHSLYFWQIYFLSTPHRWITLGLVFLDEDRFQQRPKTFVGLALFFILVITAVVMGTGGTILLVAIDYFWNAWHFAAQHSGISRIYARAARPEEKSRGLWEKFALRTFVLFAIFRAGAAACAPYCLGPEFARHTGALLFTDASAFMAGLGTFNAISESWLDAVVLVLPFLLLAGELIRFRPSAIGRLAYLGSVIAAYTALLLAVHFHQVMLTLAVALSIALFHATEYLAIVSWAVLRKPRRLAAAPSPTWPRAG